MNNNNTTATLSRQTFQHDGLTLSYLDNHQASSDIPIVLLHGFTASADKNWLESGWIDDLTRAGRRVLAIDARGHGESEKRYDSRYYPANIMMQDSVALLQQLGFSQADYGGYSMGARMAAFVAIKHPKMVRKLLLGGMGINLKTGIGKPEPIAEALLAKSLKHVKLRHAKRFRRLAEMGGNDLKALAYCILSSRQAITTDDLAMIQAQTLILVGSEDDTGGNPYGLAPFIPHSQAIEVTGCNHFNALTQTNFRRIGTQFLR